MLYYLVFINVVGFLLFALDKYKSVKRKYRISENTFFLLSIAGGFLGLIISGQIFRHKTKKIKFNIIYVFSILIWGLVFYYYFI